LGDESAFHERLTSWTGAAIPVPVRVAIVGEFAVLLTKEALTDAAPLVCGVNVTVKVALWLAGIVTGKVSPLTTNSEPPTFTDDTTTLAPVALNVPV